MQTGEEVTDIFKAVGFNFPGLYRHVFFLPVDGGSGLLTAYPQIHRLRFDPGGLGPWSAA